MVAHLPDASPTPTRGRRTALVLLAIGIACLAAGSLLAAARAMTWELVPSIHVRWHDGLPARERAALEARFLLVNPEQTHPTTWAYDLLDISASNIKALVEHEAVADTGELDPRRFEVAGDAPARDRGVWLIHRFPIARNPAVRIYLLPVLFGCAALCLWAALSLKRHGIVAGDRAAVWVWVVYLLLPVANWGIFAGGPLSIWSTAVLGAVLWLRLSSGRLRLHAMLVVALAAKITLGTMLLLPRGFEATYFANETLSGEPELSSEAVNSYSTRVDSRLDFGPERDRDLPLGFLNDSTRFNFQYSEQPDRSTLPFSVTWKGLLRVTRPGVHRVYVRSPGGEARLRIGDGTDYLASRDAERRVESVQLNPGLVPIEVRLSVPQGGARSFAAGLLVDGREVPFNSDLILRRTALPVELVIDSAVRFASLGLDILLAGWLSLVCVRHVREVYRRLAAGFSARDALSLAWPVVFVEALVFALPVVGRMVTLSGGLDWIVLESIARNIVVNGGWLTGGVLAKGDPFLFEPAYPYFVAVCHWLWGDGFFGVYFAQRLLVGVAAIATWRTTAVLFGESAGVAAIVASGAVVYGAFAPWASVLLSDVLFVPLLCLWMFGLVRLTTTERLSPRHAAGVGAIGGLATLTRSTLLPAWPLVVLPLAFAAGRTRKRWAAIAVLCLAMIGVTSLATVRNWLVSDTFVPVATRGARQLSAGNQPRLPVSVPADHVVAYERLGVTADTQAVLEYARQQPRAFLDGLASKARFALGQFGLLDPETETSFFFVGIWVIALGGITVALSRGRTRFRCAATIPLAVAASHFAGIVLTAPDGYGELPVLPFYAALVPYVGVALATAIPRIRQLGTSHVALALWAVVFMGLAWRASRAVQFDVGPLVAILALVAVCVAGLPDLGRRRVWPHLMCAGGIGVWLLSAPEPAVAGMGKVVWFLLAIDLLSGHWAGGGSLTRVRLAGIVEALCVIGGATAALWPRAGFVPVAAVGTVTAGLVVLVAWRGVENVRRLWLPGSDNLNPDPVGGEP